jgi:hypothetical protein
LIENWGAFSLRAESAPGSFSFAFFDEARMSLILQAELDYTKSESNALELVLDVRSE